MLIHLNYIREKMQKKHEQDKNLHQLAQIPHKLAKSRG